MLSIPHLIIIFVVALVVFGPEKLPELARTLGKVMGEFRRATGDLRSTFEEHMKDLEREADQRRIGGGPNPEPPQTSTVTTPPGSEPAPNTVPANAPNSAERNEAATYASVPPATDKINNTESNPETVSDGGKFPA